ncbi:MAG: hypothetical protein ACRDQ1_05670 [Sciscionella sp.]
MAQARFDARLGRRSCWCRGPSSPSQFTTSPALAAGLLADCSTRITYRQESDQLAGTTAALGLTATERDLLGDLGVGEGLWHIGKRGFLAQHHMTADEVANFDTAARMIGIIQSGGFTMAIVAGLPFAALR